ncbi:terpene synthase family protein [Actinomadura viridis]|uniref:terpene synthase family protein n=1 Tax=Actinomadura viridis TaxID=58110 RepID=UPI00367764D7
MTSNSSASPSSDAFLAGVNAATIRACERDLIEYAQEYPDLFPDKPFSTIYGEVAKTMAFSAPWCTSDDLKITCRTILWIFALDWLIDHLTKSRDEVTEITSACRAVCAGQRPGMSLARALFDIRQDLLAEPAFAQLGPVWDGELGKMLDAMSREWDWKMSSKGAQSSASRPTLDDYLANSANFGCTFTNVTQWISYSDPQTVACIDQLRSASDAIQEALRLVNDLASFKREEKWGDVNVFTLGITKEQATEHVSHLRRRIEDRLLPLESSCPLQARYLRQQLEYSVGFYSAGADYWYAD